MNYGFGKTFTIPAQFTALNGCLQYFKLTANVDLVVEPVKNEETGEIENMAEMARAQANLMRVLEVLRTYGGQPVITKVAGKVVEFTLEQANVYGKQGQMQVSEKWDNEKDKTFTEEAKERIRGLFANVKAVKLDEKDDKEELVALVAEDAEIIVYSAF